MTDPLLDDVKALLDKGFGDDRILKQIHRACEHDEIISNYERNYVRKLAEEHLGKRPEATKPETPVGEKQIIPDVVIPETPSVQKIQTFQPPPKRITTSNSKNSKLMIGIGGAALAIIIAIATSFSGVSDVSSPDTETQPVPTSNTLVIQTDLSSYSNKDIISISGKSNSSGTVNLSIENQSNELVWAEEVTLKSDGRYATLAIAGGLGWESSGTYTISVDNSKETISTTFTFTS